jgi:serine/threonine protein kinase
LALTLDQKWRVAKDLLAALAHAHQHGVVHRNLTPGAMLIGQDGTTRITDFDFAKPSVDRSLTIAADIVDLVEKAYVAPEAFREPEVPLPLLPTSSRPGSSSTSCSPASVPSPVIPPRVWDRGGSSSRCKPSALRPELNEAFDAWLQSSAFRRGSSGRRLPPWRR